MKVILENIHFKVRFSMELFGKMSKLIRVWAIQWKFKQFDGKKSNLMAININKSIKVSIECKKMNL